MAKRPKKKSSPRPRWNRKGAARPVCIRLEYDLIAAVDKAAERVGVTRTNLVALVLHEYVNARGDVEVDRLVQEDADRAKQFNLFG